MTPEQEGAELAAWTEWARTADEPFLPWRVWLARAEIAAADKARIAQLEAEVQALRVEVEALRVDAQRYRALMIGLSLTTTARTPKET